MSKTVHSTFTSLAWKEWRECLPALGIGAGVAVLIRVGSFVQISLSNRPASDLETIREIYSLIAFTLFLPAFFLLIGADRFSSEKTAGTMSYLLSLPVSKFKIWLAKLGVALGSGLVLFALTLLINPFLVEQFEKSSEQGRQWDLLFVLGIYVLLLLASFIASIVLKNPLAAAFAGTFGLAVFVLALALLDFFGVRNLIILIAGSPIARYPSPTVSLGALLALFTGASLSLFVLIKTDNSGIRKAGFFALAISGTLGAMLLTALADNVPCLLLSQSDVVRAGQVDPVPGTDTTLFMIANKCGYTRICSVPVSGGPVKRLPGKSMSCPSVSPDGRTVLCNPDNLTWPQAAARRYIARNRLRNLFSPLLWEDWARTPSLEGPGDWALEHGSRIMLLRFPDARRELLESVVTERGPDIVDFSIVSWSPDGKRFAIGSVPGLLLVTVKESLSIKRIPPGVQGYAWLHPSGWSDDGKEFFFIADQWEKEGNRTSLCRFDPESGESMVLFTAHVRRICGFCPSRKLVYTSEWQRRSSSHKLFVTDIGTGEERLLGENTVGPYAIWRAGERLFSPKSGVFLFAVRNNTERGNVLELFDPEVKSARTVAEVADLIPLSLSPDARWGLCYRREETGAEDANAGLYSVNLETGETHTIEKDGVNLFEGTAWAEGPTVVFVKGNKEIWSAAIDGSRSRRLYPEKKQ